MKQKITIKTVRFVKSLDNPLNQLWYIETTNEQVLAFFTNNQEGINKVNNLKINYTYIVDVEENDKGKYIKEFIDFVDTKKHTTNKDIPIGLMSLIKTNIELNKNNNYTLKDLINESEEEYLELLKRWC